MSLNIDTSMLTTTYFSASVVIRLIQLIQYKWHFYTYMFEFIKHEAHNYIISPGCLPVPMIMSNIGSKTLHYLLEVKKRDFSAQIVSN